MGVELKPSYFKQAIRNMETAEADAKDLLSRVS
jgi:hypothetical protein